MVNENADVIHATLIHGTFARNAAWTKEGSFLRERLQKAFSDRIHFHDDFVWSGLPTHIARHLAAVRLKSYLLELTQRLSGRHILICHSHGGMAAAYALRDPVLQSKIAGLVTLSTPFLVARRRQLSLFGQIVGVATCIAIVLITGLLFGRYGPYLRPTLVAASPGLAPYIPETYSAITGGLVLLFVCACIIAAIILTGHLTQWLLATLEIPKLSAKRTLIVRGPSDEASALLMLFHALELLITVLWGRRAPFDSYIKSRFGSFAEKIDEVVDPVIRPIFLCLVPVGGIIFISAPLWFYFSWHPQSYSDIADDLNTIWAQLGGWRLVLACVAIILALPFLLGIALMTAFFALAVIVGAPFVILMPAAIAICAVLAVVTVPELGPATATIIVSTEAAPPGTFSIVQLPDNASTSDGFLTHSLSYTSPIAANEIIQWIRSVMTTTDDELIVIKPVERISGYGSYRSQRIRTD